MNTLKENLLILYPHVDPAIIEEFEAALQDFEEDTTDGSFRTFLEAALMLYEAVNE